MGNYVIISGNAYDNLVQKAIDLNCPDKIFPLLFHHRPMLYYPDPLLIRQIFNYYKDNKNRTEMKKFFDIILQRPYLYFFIIYLVILLKILLCMIIILLILSIIKNLMIVLILS